MLTGSQPNVYHFFSIKISRLRNQRIDKMGHRPITIHDVSQDIYEFVKGQLVDHHDASFADGVYSVDGVEARFDYDRDRDCLTVELMQHPSVVTPGYLIGFLYDQITAGPPATVTDR